MEIKSRWAKALSLDPYLNPNLARGEQYTLDGAFPYGAMGTKDFNQRIQAQAGLIFTTPSQTQLVTAGVSTQT
jgi:hypothetical protein